MRMNISPERRTLRRSRLLAVTTSRCLGALLFAFLLLASIGLVVNLGENGIDVI